MFVDLQLKPNEVKYIKIVKTNQQHIFSQETQNIVEPNRLEIKGFTDQNEVLF